MFYLIATDRTRLAKSAIPAWAVGQSDCRMPPGRIPKRCLQYVYVCTQARRVKLIHYQIQRKAQIFDVNFVRSNRGTSLCVSAAFQNAAPLRCTLLHGLSFGLLFFFCYSKHLDTRHVPGLTTVYCWFRSL